MKNCSYDEILEAAYAGRAELEVEKENDRVKLNKRFGSGMKKQLQHGLGTVKIKKQTVKVEVNEIREKGNTLFKEGKLMEALNVYQDALVDSVLLSEQIKLHANISLTLLKLGNSKSALDSVEKGLKLIDYERLRACDVKLIVRKVTALLNLKKYDEAAGFLEGCISLTKQRKVKAYLESIFEKHLPLQYDDYKLPAIEISHQPQGPLGPKATKLHDDVNVATSTLSRKTAEQFESAIEKVGMSIVDKMGTNSVLAQHLEDDRLAHLAKNLAEYDLNNFQASKMKIGKQYGKNFIPVAEELFKFLRSIKSKKI
eukprot:augustus_masked-scaffold_33-processed-gene-3.56-mRNA-1 protein AED:1.00 eAED:1.00 QI:0/-1/0/0/-1/1/1/0/312